MNCRDIEPVLLAERDGVLTPEQHAALAKHVAACPACRRSRIIYGEAVTFLKTDAANVAVPDVEEEWRALRPQMRGNFQGRPAKKRPLAPLIWFGAPLAAAAALTVAFFVSQPKSVSPAPLPVARSSDPLSANESTIAYVDSDSGWLVVWSAEAEAKGSG